MQACRCIQAQSGDKDLVIIAQTGWGQEEDRQRTHEAGFDHHMVKPVDPQALTKSSDWNCPIEKPWFSAGPDQKKGGGFLAIFDPDFKKLQIGTFPGVPGMETMAVRGKLIVVGG